MPRSLAEQFSSEWSVLPRENPARTCCNLPLAWHATQGLRILSLGNLQEQSLQVVVTPAGLLSFSGDASF